MSERGTELKPFYRKSQDTHEGATPTYMIVVDEGWRESILRIGMYEWAADWLVEQLQGKTYARKPEWSEVRR